MRWIFLFISVDAVAAGGAGDQGPRFLGAGLDEAPTPGYIQEFSSAAFPPNVANPTPVTKPPFHPNPVFTLSQLACTPDTKNPTLLARCSAVVNAAVPPSAICKGPDLTTNKIKLIALKAKWDLAHAALDFSPSSSIVFACEDPIPPTPDPQDLIGAFGKCVRTGFFDAPADKNKFLACVRAMRADYCGIGASFTLAGTPLGIYDNPPVCIIADGCYEASWDDGGAVCINHARYEHLVLLSTIKDLCLATPSQSSVSPWKNPRLHAAGVPAGVCPATTKKTTRIDGLNVCGTQFEPIATCLSQYTDFYYDDDPVHKMGPMTPINAVTSQFVCRTGKTRKFPGAVLTRTKVRFVVSSTKTDDLPCCDTLKDCP
jgi:hypothetical protein